MKQNLFAFWEYPQFPYCLGGKVDHFKGELVYISAYQSYFKPFKIIEQTEGLELYSKIIKLTNERDNELKNLEKKFNQKLKELIEIPK